MAQTRVFISYRRSDTQGEAGRLAELLERELGAGSVFRDVDGIAPGKAFERELERKLNESDIVLVLIGKRWLSELGTRVGRDEPDYVRLEVSAALDLDKRVIPVLLQGADMPVAADIGDDLRGLAKRHSISVRDESWRQDAARLVNAIGRPFAWGACGLRALFVFLLVILFAWFGVPHLGVEPEAQIKISRALVVAALILTLGAEWFWHRHR